MAAAATRAAANGVVPVSTSARTRVRVLKEQRNRSRKNRSRKSRK
jgi:hypothetical protein